MANLTGSTTAVFFVRLSAAVDEIVDVDWNTRDGTAVAGEDYESASGTASFLPGETEKAIVVVVYGQGDVTADGKKFYIELKPPANAVLSDALAECVITVADEDGVLVTSLVIAQGKRGLKGDPGLSAYEHAVLMGYEGTVEQWMDEIGDASQAAERAESFASQAAESAVVAGQKANEANEAVGSTKQYVDAAVGAISTDASKQYATLAAANADIANIAVGRNVFISEAANGGYWYKETAGSTSLTKSPYDPVKLSKDAIPQNLLFDPFNETVNVITKDDSLQCYSNAVFETIVIDSTFNKPALQSNDLVRRNLDPQKIGLKTGDQIYLRMLVNFSAVDSTSRANASTYKSDGTLIAQHTFVPVSIVSDVLHGPIAITSDTAYIQLHIAGTGQTKKLIATAVSTLPKPKFVYGSVRADLVKSFNDAIASNTNAIASNTTAITSLSNKIDVVNLMPDAFFRLHKAGITTVDGYALNQESGWSIIDYPDSKFPAKLAMRSTIATKNRRLKLSLFGLKAGDKLTVRLGITTANSGWFFLGVYVRNAANTVVGSATNSNTAVVANTYVEAAHTITLTQEQIDTGAYIEVRQTLNSATTADDLYILGFAAYKNDATSSIKDTSEASDNLIIAEQYTDTKVAEITVVIRPVQYGLENLRETRWRLRSLREGVTGANAMLSIAAIGDSYTHNIGRYIFKVATALWRKYQSNALAPNGLGFISFGGVGGSLPNGTINWNAYAKVASGTVDVSAYGTGGGPDICQAVMSADSVIYLDGGITTNKGISYTIMFEGGAGSVQWSFDNGTTWSSVLDLTTFPAGLQTYEIDVSAWSGVATKSFRIKAITQSTIYGINAVLKNTAGIVFHKLGATGTRAQQWAAVDAARWKAGLSVLAPNLVTIMHGTNDQTGGRTKAQFKADIKTIIDRVLEVNPVADILLMSPPENQRGLATKISTYADAMYELAQEYKCAYLDMQPHFGVNPPDYAFGSLRPLFASDGIHPEPNTGGYAMQDAVLYALGEQGA